MFDGIFPSTTEAELHLRLLLGVNIDGAPILEGAGGLTVIAAARFTAAMVGKQVACRLAPGRSDMLIAFGILEPDARSDTPSRIGMRVDPQTGRIRVLADDIEIRARRHLRLCGGVIDLN